MNTLAKFWNAMPTAAKLSSAAIIGIFAVISYLTSFQTDAEAAEMEKAITKKLDDTRIEQNDLKIQDYEFKLLEPGLTEEQKQWIDRQIKKLEAKNTCIRKKEC